MGSAHTFFFPSLPPLLSLPSRCPSRAPGANFQAAHINVAPVGVAVQPQVSGGGGERRVRGLPSAFLCFVFRLVLLFHLTHTHARPRVDPPHARTPQTQGYSYGPAKLVYAPAKVNYNPQKGPVYAPIGVDMAEPEGGSEDADRQ